jgi:4'-phosphopantetheinyl transferase
VSAARSRGIIDVMTHLWWAHVQDARPELVDLLPDDEVTRMRRYRRAADQDRHLVAWALTRVILGGTLGCSPAAVPISRSCLHCGETGHGKPRLGGSGPHFSLSHAGDRVIVTVSGDGPVGVDTEVDTDGADEIDSLVRGSDEEPAHGPSLLRRWVRKEAVLKATGHGLSMPMTCFAVSPPHAAARLLSWPADPSLPGRLALRDLASPVGYAAAVAVIGHLDTMTTHSGSAVLAEFTA